MMYDIKEHFKGLNIKLDNLTSKIKYENHKNILNALNNSKRTVNKWMKVEDVVVVFSDLKNSTDISLKKQKKTVSNILEYINTPFIEIHQKFGAEFIDMKGDGGIALYSTSKELNSILASITVCHLIIQNT